MSKDPAFLFYSSDFLTGTMLMTHEEVGKYIRLLCLQHQKGRLTKKQVLSICLASDLDVLEKFCIDSDGKYFNQRLEDESKKRAKFTESRRQNAKGLKNKDLEKDSAEHMPNHMEDENEDVNENRNGVENILPVEFSNDEFKAVWDYWIEYRKKLKLKKYAAPEVALKKLLDISEGDSDTAIKIIQQSVANNWQGLFALKPQSEAKFGNPYKFTPDF